MTKRQALQLLIAAEDDPILAAWVSVIWPLDMMSAVDISPYDAWEAYQMFWTFGLVPDRQYHHLDRQVFFTTKPTLGSYQRVAHNLKMLPPLEEPMEPPVSKRTPLGDNLFESDAALVARDQHTGLTSGRVAGTPLPSRPNGDMFAPQREVHLPRPDMFDGDPALPPSPARTGLPCNDPIGRGSVARHGAYEIRFELRCLNQGCGDVVEMMVEEGGTQYAGPDELPGGSVGIFDVVMHGFCPRCQTKYHTSAGRPDPR